MSPVKIVQCINVIGLDQIWVFLHKDKGIEAEVMTLDICVEQEKFTDVLIIQF